MAKEIYVTEVFGGKTPVQTLNNTIDVVRQGEGYYTGTPSIFVRTFGCNFQCLGFGMPAGKLSDEAIHAIPFGAFARSLEDLPLVTTGCDSYAAHMKEFRHLSTLHTAESLIDEILALIPDNEINNPVYYTHLVLTGGESLLQRNQDFYIDVLTSKRLAPFISVTFETNGTQMLTPAFIEMLKNTSANRKYTFSISAKLSNSGESRKRAIKPQVVKQYQEVGQLAYLKFVVQSEDNIAEINSVLDEYYSNGVNPIDVYLMPCGGTIEQYKKFKDLVHQLSQSNNFKFSQRLHLDLYGNSWST